MLLCLLFLAAFNLNLNWALKASCNMRLHDDGTEIGKVIFTSNGNKQSIQANLEGDPEIITEGAHGFHIHQKPVEGNDCGADSTGGHYNPEGNTHGDFHSPSDSRHVGDFGNVQAGERGEVNFYADITIDKLGDVGFSMMGRPAIHCGPYMVKVWSDGRRERLYGQAIEVEKRRGRKGTKGKKKKRCTKKKQKKGLCTKEPLPDLIPIPVTKPPFYYEFVDPDCYVPMSENLDLTLHTRRFELEGDQSVVGRAVVLHAGRDDLGRGVGEAREGSLKTGNAGSRIACCTLDLDE